MLSEVLAGSGGGDVRHYEPGTDGPEGPVLGSDPPGALGGHVQVVGDGPGGHLQHVVGGSLVCEDAAQRRQEGAWGAAGMQI